MLELRRSLDLVKHHFKGPYGIAMCRTCRTFGIAALSFVLAISLVNCASKEPRLPTDLPSPPREPSPMPPVAWPPRTPPEQPSPPGPGRDRSEPNAALIPVFFATDRDLLPSASLAFGVHRNVAEKLYLGRIDVSVPRDHHEIGQVERPSVWKFFREDPNKHFTMRHSALKSYEDFYHEIRDIVATDPTKQAFVFVHGYNVAFDTAVYRTAQISYDLQFPGATILYSWPSAAKELAYSADVQSSEWSKTHLRWFLEDVASKSGADVVHVIAHSMGNQPTIWAMNQIAQQSAAQTRTPFRHLVLAAPDIDASVFRQLAALLCRSAARVTLYASANDRALQLSRKYQGGYQRAGEALPRVIVVNGIDTIDVSLLRSDFWEHSYFAQNVTVISDLFYLLRNVAPEQRHRLFPQGTPPDRYWVFRP